MSIIDQLQCNLANRIRKFYVNVLLFYYGSILHLCWGFMLLFGIYVHTTGVEPLYQVFGPFAGVMLLVASILGFYAISNNGKMSSFILLLPQQGLLLLSALGAIECVARGRFADGAVYPPMFIFVDQLPIILIAIMHSVSMFAFGLYLAIKTRVRP